ncbi:MAG TPA: VanZ family protein [Candidatus Acidoferrales bacterium]
MSWLKRWWPALIWAVAISGFSTKGFSSEHTSRIIIPFLHWLLPSASHQTLEIIHHIIRKCAHFTEYFILSLLILRGVRAGEKGWHLRWALVTVLIIFAYAGLDEFHQSFVPGRQAAFTDVLIDTSGGIAAQIIASLVVLLGGVRRQRLETEAAALQSNVGTQTKS